MVKRQGAPEQFADFDRGAGYPGTIVELLAHGASELNILNKVKSRQLTPTAHRYGRRRPALELKRTARALEEDRMKWKQSFPVHA
jgi:hypothetical protein